MESLKEKILKVGKKCLEEGKADKEGYYDIHLQKPYELDEKVQFLKEAELAVGKKIRPHIYK